MFLNLKEIGESKTKEGFCGAGDARSSLHVPKFAERDIASSSAYTYPISYSIAE